MSGITVKIGADVSGFKRGQADAVASAKRGAQEIAVAYAGSSALATATMKSLTINLAAMQLASGNLLSTMTGLQSASKMDTLAALGRDASQSGMAIGAVQEKLNALPPTVANVAEAFAVFEAVTTVWKAFNAAIEDTETRMARLNAIGAAAREIGTGPTFLTTLIAQAKDLRIETETLTGMLIKAREASRVQIGVGKDAVNESVFQTRLRQNVMAGNLTAADAAPYNAAKDQEGQIRAVLDLLEKLKAANREIAANDLGRTFFGADFEAKTRQGIDLIGAFRRALDNAKIEGGSLAPTAEEIARTEQMAARQEAIAATIRDAISPAVRDFNELSDLGKNTWLDWQEHVAGWVKWLGEGYLKIRDVAATVKKMAQDWGVLGADPGTKMVPEGESPPLTLRVGAGRKPADRSNPLPSLGSAGKGRTARDPQDQDSVANVIRQLERTRDIAEAELKTVGLTNVEREKAVSLAKAEAAARADVEKGVRDSAALTSDEIARATKAAESTARAKDKLMDLEQALHANADAARYFGEALSDSLADALVDGRSLEDVLNNVTKMLARGAIQALITGQGPLAGVLGTAPAASQGRDAVGGLAGMFSGGGGGLFSALPKLLGFAEGGIIEGPGTGTSDSILARVSAGEAIIPARVVAMHAPLVKALVSDRIPRFADGHMPDLGALAASSMDAQDARMRGTPDVNVPKDHGGMTTEVTIVGGDTTAASTTMGPRGPRMEIQIDKAVAAALMSGGDTRKALKKLTGNRMTG